MNVSHRPVGVPTSPAVTQARPVGGALAPQPPMLAANTTPVAADGFSSFMASVKHALSGLFTFVRDVVAAVFSPTNMGRVPLPMPGRAPLSPPQPPLPAPVPVDTTPVPPAPAPRPVETTPPAEAPGEVNGPAPAPQPGSPPVVTPPAPTPKPIAAPDNTAGKVLFDADVARRGLSAYSNVIHPERITIVDDPILGDARKVMKFTVYDTDIGPTENPRAQVETPTQFKEGDEIWVGWSTLFPSSWPDKLPSGGTSWLTLSEVYGRPYAGAAPVKIGMRSGQDALTFQRNKTYGYDIPWEQGPIQKNQWYDFVVRQKLSQDGTEGFVELYMNDGTGWKQQLVDGKERLYMKTLDDSNNASANYHKLALYRKKGMYDVMTVYHADHRVATSFDAAAPNSYPASR